MKTNPFCGTTFSIQLLSATLATASLLILSTASAHAQGGVPLWTNRYDGGRGLSDFVRAMAVDNDGNVFVAGLSNPDECVTIKYSGAGVPLWTNRYNEVLGHESFALAVAVDGSGNVFVTGGANNGSYNGYLILAYSSVGVPLWTNRYFALDGGPANAVAVDSDGKVFVTGTAPGKGADYATLAYSNAGIPLWTNLYGGFGDDSATAIAVDRSGNVFVTGNAYNGSNLDFATIKYSNTGVPLWTNRYNGPGNGHDAANAMAVDNSGNVFVTGSSPGIGTSSDYATIKYSNQGVPLWTNRYDGPASQDDYAVAIAVDSNGNVVVTGRSFGIDTVSDYDYLTIKYSNQGVPLWTNRYDGPANLYDAATAIAVDRSGNVFVTGLSTDVGGSASATIAYSPAGDLLWENRYNGPDWPHAIAVDRDGNVFVTGESGDSAGFNDVVTIKYSSSLPPPVQLDYHLLNNQLVLSWTNATLALQSAPAVTGPFTNLLGATSPYTNSMISAQQYFRLAAPE